MNLNVTTVEEGGEGLRDAGGFTADIKHEFTKGELFVNDNPKVHGIIFPFKGSVVNSYSTAILIGTIEVNDISFRVINFDTPNITPFHE